MVDLPEERSLWALNTMRYEVVIGFYMKFRAPLIICVNKIGDVSIVDATILEENCATSSIYVGVVPPDSDFGSVRIHLILIFNCLQQVSSVSDDDCIVTLVRKAKGGSLELESIEEMINTGVRSGRDLNRALMRRLAEEKMDSLKPTASRSLTFLVQMVL